MLERNFEREERNKMNPLGVVLKLRECFLEEMGSPILYVFLQRGRWSQLASYVIFF